MFDDPKKRLRELEDQLLAEETITEKPDDEFQIDTEILADMGDDEVPIRNFANGYGRNIQPATPAPMPEEEPIPTKRERIGGLVFLAVIECLIFAGLAAIWLGGSK